MVKCSYCIQECDYSVTDFDPISYEESVKIIKSIDWDNKIETQHRMENEKKDNCPFNVIFNNEERFFQVLKKSDGYTVITSLNKQKKRILIFLFIRNQILYDADKLEEDKLYNLTALFFEEKFNELAGMLQIM